eukprot:CAMPEP_0201528218 /NCGR_PEP_ID=MMETSP0161_2-20130828/37710_1 /ASSEMBLY_ACC=CAM_ASM_000251 /TAXON_ID=180227 /ORGANISM="Neoparamoeba aestuarina, Strain SoJaBio B1-5/56/2" /LENGTH=66 /DNA_ID=CAMNT_0047929411 /DNA_START=144 /DNA_END=340 /DNA_ORIENTATION=+
MGWHCPLFTDETCGSDAKPVAKSSIPKTKDVQASAEIPDSKKHKGSCSAKSLTATVHDHTTLESQL